MSTTIDDLKSYIQYFARPNQYDIILTPPKDMSTLPTPPDSAKAFRCFCKSLSIPSITSENNITKVLNVIRGTALGINYDTCVMTFFDTNTAYFHRLFHTWITSRYGGNGTLQFYPDE